MFQTPDNRYEFFKKSLRSLSLALANVEGGAPWEKVELLLKYFPKKAEDGIYFLDVRACDGVTALVAYFINSKLNQKEKLFPYFADLFESMASAHWPPYNPKENPLFPEVFATTLSQILAHIGQLDETLQYEVLRLRQKVIDNVGRLIADAAKDANTLTAEQRLAFETIHFPIFRGLSLVFGDPKSDFYKTVRQSPVGGWEFELTKNVERSVVNTVTEAQKSRSSKRRPKAVNRPVIPNSLSAVIGCPVGVIPDQWESYLKTKNALPSPLRNSSSKLADGNEEFSADDLIPSLLYRTWYDGKLHGLLKCGSLESVTQRLLSSLREEDAHIVPLDDFEEALWTATALILSDESPEDRVIEAVCCAPAKRFSQSVMCVAVKCWNWILSKPELTLTCMHHVMGGFFLSFGLRQGIFSPPPCSNPCSSSPPPPLLVAPHDIWIHFICEVVEKDGPYHDDLVDLFLYFMQRTFPATIGSNDIIHLNRSVRAIRPRFRLMRCALSLLQKNIKISDLAKAALRTRIYSTCLDYFCQGYECPPQKGDELRGGIEEALKFWDLVMADLRYIRAFSVAGYTFGDLNSQGTNKSKNPNGIMKWMGKGVKPTPKKNGGEVQEELKSTVEKKELEAEPQKKQDKLGDMIDECIWKRNMILELLGREIEMWLTWYNLRGSSKLKIEAALKIKKWRKKNPNPMVTPEAVPKIWETSPVLAIHLARHIRPSERCSGFCDQLSTLVRRTPEPVMHLSDAISYFLTPDAVVMDGPELVNILTWSTCSPIQALSLFNRDFPAHPYACQYAIRSIRSYPPESMFFYIQQMVQALRKDKHSYMAEYIRGFANSSQLLAHQLIWNMNTSVYTDEQGKERDPEIGEVLEDLVESMVRSFPGGAKEFYQKEFDFFRQITGVSGAIRMFPKGPLRDKACLEELAKIDIKQGCYLPSNPESLVVDVDKQSGTPMQSASKAPYLARFRVVQCGFTRVECEGLGLKVNSNPEPKDIGPEMWQAAIFKVGDDVRQDMLALQIISLFKVAYDRASLPLFLYSYRVVATSPGTGVIECVPSAISRAQLGKKTKMSLYHYFLAKYGPEDSKPFKEARNNFMSSLASYTIVCFILQIKDRHNGNILIDDAGHIIHIDFGFMFESSPGRNMGFEPNLKLTSEMVRILGGKADSPFFKEFLELCVQGFLAIRPYQESVITLVSLMLHTKLPCFRGQTIKLLRKRFRPDATDREAADYIMKVIKKSYKSFRTTMYDAVQYYQNKIPY